MFSDFPRVLPFVVLLSGMTVFCACESNDSDMVAPTSPAATPLPVPFDITVKQRTTAPVAGSNSRLAITIDDITRNQVMVSLSADAAETVLPTRSFSPHDTASFQFAGQTYALTLLRLDNALIGEDVATFEVTTAALAGLSEAAQIERLIATVAALRDATFIRNGTEHSATEAAEHLRTKWQAASAQITTARQFIDEVASQSSLTGEPYQIRMADGSIIDARAFLKQHLATISASTAKH